MLVAVKMGARKFKIGTIIHIAKLYGTTTKLIQSVNINQSGQDKVYCLMQYFLKTCEGYVLKNTFGYTNIAAILCEVKFTSHVLGVFNTRKEKENDILDCLQRNKYNLKNDKMVFKRKPRNVYEGENMETHFLQNTLSSLNVPTLKAKCREAGITGRRKKDKLEGSLRAYLQEEMRKKDTRDNSTENQETLPKDKSREQGVGKSKARQSPNSQVNEPIPILIGGVSTQDQTDSTNEGNGCQRERSKNKSNSDPNSLPNDLTDKQLTTIAGATSHDRDMNGQQLQRDSNIVPGPVALCGTIHQGQTQTWFAGTQCGSICITAIAMSFIKKLAHWRLLLLTLL